MGCDLGRLQRLPPALPPADAACSAGGAVALTELIETGKVAAANAALLCALGQCRGRGKTPHALVAVVARREGPALLHVAGLASMREGRPARPDTPFYLASQTKSYVGLLAARLDADAILPLEHSLEDVWPGLTLPGLPANRITMRHLLTHRLALTHDAVVETTSFQREVPAAAYPELLARAEPRETGYRYDNLGYLVYAASLETVTGREWKHWLDERICRPLGLCRTSARSSDFPASELAWRHVREQRRWRTLPPKPDALMHAAGGLYSSPVDLATWMQAHLARGAGDVTEAHFRCAHRLCVHTRSVDGPFRWTGYALGLQCGSIAGIRVLGHRGGYPGARSLGVIAPSANVGLALAVNADFGTRELLDRLAQAFFGALASST